MTLLHPEKLRWHDYVLERGGELSSFWRDHFDYSGHKPLVVLAKSFDPRTCVALEQILNSGTVKNCDLFVLNFDDLNKSADAELKQLAESNFDQLRHIMNPIGKISAVDLRTGMEDNQRITANSAADVFQSLDRFQGYTDIVVDVSGMPRSVYFPMLAKLLYLMDNASPDRQPLPNLFAVVSEDPTLDAAIDHEGVDDFAEFLPYFRGDFDREAISDLPHIWIPILGEHRLPQLERIEDQVKPSETCPVLPSPSRDPRRGDNLVMEYQTYLFDNRRGIDTRNFIYASEDNPFEVYRQLCGAVYRWHETLKPLGGCNVAFSALSSKLMSLGALLSAYDLKTQNIPIGVAHVGCDNYRIKDCEPNTEVFGLWLTGRCYDE